MWGSKFLFLSKTKYRGEKIGYRICRRKKNDTVNKKWEIDLIQKNKSKKNKKKISLVKKLKVNKLKINLKKIPNYNLINLVLGNIIEILFIVVGLVLLIHPVYSNLKIAFTLLFIGSFLILLLHNTPDKKQRQEYHAFEQINFSVQKPSFVFYFKEKKKKPISKIILKKFEIFKNKIIQLKNISFTISDKVTFFIIFWTLILYIFTLSVRIEIYYILIFISLIATRELSNPIATDELKKRINLFIIVFLAAYLYIFTQRLFEVL